MADPTSPTTWFGLNPALLLGMAGAVGGVLTKAVGIVWRAMQKRRQDVWEVNQKDKQDVADALREQITTLREQLAVERSEKTRLTEERDRLGLQKDELRGLLERERLRAAGVVYRIQQNAEVDDSLVDDMPTAVHERANLIAGTDPHAKWGANPNPENRWDPTLSTPTGLKPTQPKPPRPGTK